MIHLGDITKIHGDQIEPVDCITFGSPCQDLSMAGLRAGLEGKNSGLFTEAIRVIVEMRVAVNEVVHSFRPFVIHPGGAVDRHSTDYKMKSILLFSPAGRVVSRCFVRFRAASFPDPGDNAHCRRRG